MNREKILKVADALEQVPFGAEPGTFRLSHYMHECGAPACIAGWTVALEIAEYDLEKAATLVLVDELGMDFDTSLIDRDGNIHHAAGAILELPYSEANALFTPPRWPTRSGPKQAVRVLRYLADYGIVDWETDYETEPA